MSLRHRVPMGMMFGSEEGRDAYLARLHELWTTMKTPYCVALGVGIPVRGGRVLRDGDPITADDVGGQVELLRLIEQGRVLCRD